MTPSGKKSQWLVPHAKPFLGVQSGVAIGSQCSNWHRITGGRNHFLLMTNIRSSGLRCRSAPHLLSAAAGSPPYCRFEASLLLAIFVPRRVLAPGKWSLRRVAQSSRLPLRSLRGSACGSSLLLHFCNVQPSCLLAFCGASLKTRVPRWRMRSVHHSYGFEIVADPVSVKKDS